MTETKKASKSLALNVKNGAPGTIRTCDRLVRSKVLYPAELRALDCYGDMHCMCAASRGSGGGTIAVFTAGWQEFLAVFLPLMQQGPPDGDPCGGINGGERGIRTLDGVTPIHP